jgi:flagellar motor switch/type III secretory pathway protein FliN
MGENGKHVGSDEMMVELAIELGRTRTSIDSLMRLREGSLIQLDAVSGDR